jgi:large subunit ribosomal protein L33
MREYVTMECSECKSRGYRTSLETREAKKLSMKKFCRSCGKHTVHNSRKK